MPTSHPTIDDNSISVGLGTWMNRVHDPLTNTWNFFPVVKAFSLNPSGPLGKSLRIEIIPRTLTASLVPNQMPIDNNSYNVAGGITNNAAKLLFPLSVDVISGIPALRADITII